MKRTTYVRDRRFFEEDDVEQFAQVPAEGNPKGPRGKTRVLGAPVNRFDGYDKVSGTARYTFDVDLPHMAHAKTLRSPHPHARIRSIDTSEAEVLPGVLAILHSGNSPAIPWYGQSTLFDTHLRYQGDEVACVAATTEKIAEQALKLIRVDYEVLDFEVDVEKMASGDGPALHDGGPLAYQPWIYERGNVEAGFAEADVLVEESFSTQCAVHNPTEAHGSVASWDGDKLTVYDSTQAIHTIRTALAESMQIPASHVEVITKYMGGGFGSKLYFGKYTTMATLLARRIGLPVKIMLDRSEMNLAVGNRPDSRQQLKVGAKRDGTLTAMSLTAIGSAGAYRAWAGCNFPLIGTYKCANVRTDMRSVYTNLGPGRAFRAPGRPQGTFGMDSILDDLAAKLEMDPLELRRKNYAEIDQFQNQPYTSKKLNECYDLGARAFGWSEKWHPPGISEDPVKRGVGLATQIWSGGGGPPGGVTLQLNADGSVRALAGSQDLGTGTYTFIPQVVAEVLEIPVENVRATLGRTSAGPYCPPSGGSQTAPTVAPAAHDAAVQIRGALLDGAAALWELPRKSLVYENATIRSEDGEKVITIPELMEELHENTLVRTGLRAANVPGKTAQSFGVQFAEVEVDTRTGEVRVLKIIAAHDIGRTLNRKLLENQFHGGIIQGFGFALFEERIVDRNTGLVLSDNLHDYKMATMRDVPEIEVIVVDPKDKEVNSLGVKGIGEPPIIPTAGAIANAVFNATGVRIHELPLTPDRVLTALQMVGG